LIGLAKILATLEFNRHDDVLKMVKAGFNEETIIEGNTPSFPPAQLRTQALRR
jgi:hypothetical protein